MGDTRMVGRATGVRRRAGRSIGLVAFLLLAGCGAGQQAQTSSQVTATGGVGGQVGSIVVRDAKIVWDGPVPGDAVYRRGDVARLQFTVVNEATAAVAGGAGADRLVGVHSPVARSSRIDGDTRVPDGHVLTAGYEDPVASLTLPQAEAIDVALVGLTEPVRAGFTYPVVFTFERAGELRLYLPVGNPDVLPSRAVPQVRDRRGTEVVRSLSGGGRGDAVGCGNAGWATTCRGGPPTGGLTRTLATDHEES